jgi:hypothetical protein
MNESESDKLERRIRELQEKADRKVRERQKEKKNEQN